MSTPRDRLNQSVGMVDSDPFGKHSAAMILDQLRDIKDEIEDIKPRLLPPEHVSYLTRWVEERQALERVGGRWKGFASAIGAFALAAAVMWGGFADAVRHVFGGAPK